MESQAPPSGEAIAAAAAAAAEGHATDTAASDIDGASTRSSSSSTSTIAASASAASSGSSTSSSLPSLSSSPSSSSSAPRVPVINPRRLSGAGSHENFSPQIIQRLAREVRELMLSPPEGVTVVPNEEEETLMEVHCDMAGPVGTPYEEGVFRLKLVMSSNFPSSPPRAFFLTRIFHPNVAPSGGDVCVNTLKKDWSAKLTLSHVLQVIRCLLIVPFPESSLNDEAGKLFMSSYDEYARRARLLTGVHAARRRFRPRSPNNPNPNPKQQDSGGAGAGAGGKRGGGGGGGYVGKASEGEEEGADHSEEGEEGGAAAAAAKLSAATRGAAVSGAMAGAAVGSRKGKAKGEGKVLSPAKGSASAAAAASAGQKSKDSRRKSLKRL